MIDEHATNMSYKLNGFSQNANRCNNQTQMNGHQAQMHQKSNSIKSPCETNGVHNSSDVKTLVNGAELSNGGSPLRSQLGLNLKSAAVSVKKSPNMLQVTFYLICFSFSTFS